MSDGVGTRAQPSSEPGAEPRSVTDPHGSSVEQLVRLAQSRDPDPRFADLDDEALVRAARTAAAEVAAATCRWLELLAEVLVRGAWAGSGAATPAQWLSYVVAMSPTTAREHCRVALALADWPEVTSAFRAGELSYTQVRAITRSGRPELERILLRFARHATGAQLEQIVRDINYVQQRDGLPDAWERRELLDRPISEDMTEITVRIPTEEAARAKGVLTRRADALWRAMTEGMDAEQRSEAGVPSKATLKVDALLEAIEALAVSGPADVSGADRHLLVLHVTEDDLEAPAEGSDHTVVAGLGNGGSPTGGTTRRLAMSARRLRRLACDTQVAVVAHDGDGNEVGVSGTTRRVPSRLRRLLLARDATCRFPGCHRTRGLQAHHIVHVADGGDTTLANLVLLCHHHHKVVHQGWEILTDGRGHFRFQPPDGPVLPTTRPLPGASAEAPAVEGLHWRSLTPSWDGRRLERNECLSAIFEELERLRAPALAATA